MWEYQVDALVETGHRVIAYDRRGFGNSTHTASGYDYDTLATDLNELITKLNLKRVTLAGFSMGGGEVARYCAKFGTGNIERVMLIAAIPPFMLKTSDNPEGVDQTVFDGMMQGVKSDRPAFLDQFGKMFVNYETTGKNRVSEDALQYSKMIGSLASATATKQCAIAFATTDFRKDLPAINVPTLIIHGDSDQIVPFEVSGKRSHEMMPNSQLELIKGGSHGLMFTDTAILNELMAKFMTG